MGIEHSQEDFSRFTLSLYEGALQSTCLLPNAGIDEALLKFSGTDSNSVLYTYSNQLATNHPNFMSNFTSALGSTRNVGNAVGIGAFVLSIVMDFSISPNPAQQTPYSYSMFQRVFGEQKASDVRDTMSEYIKRHQMFMNNDNRLLEEIKTLERQLGGHLTGLRNSMLYDGWMSSRRFKIWVNGAFFHLQMLLHEARLTKKLASDFVDSINTAVSLYLQDLDKLQEKYKTFKTSTTTFLDTHPWLQACILVDTEANCEVTAKKYVSYDGLCDDPKMIEGYMNHVFSKYEPISGMKKQFTGIQTNINHLITQHDAFTLTQSVSPAL